MQRASSRDTRPPENGPPAVAALAALPAVKASARALCGGGRPLHRPRLRPPLLLRPGSFSRPLSGTAFFDTLLIFWINILKNYTPKKEHRIAPFFFGGGYLEDIVFVPSVGPASSAFACTLWGGTEYMVEVHGLEKLDCDTACKSTPRTLPASTHTPLQVAAAAFFLYRDWATGQHRPQDTQAPRHTDMMHPFMSETVLD